MRTTIAPALAVALIVAGCSGQTADVPEQGPGVPVPARTDPPPPLYSPVNRAALAYGLPSAVSGVPLVPSPVEIILADEQDLATDPVIHRLLVERALGPDVIRIEQREDDPGGLPRVAVGAIQIKGVPAELFAEFVPSFYLRATSATDDDARLPGKKPSRVKEVIEGREIWTSNWDDFIVDWYPYGDVVYVVMAENPQLLAAALRQLPWPAASGSAASGSAASGSADPGPSGDSEGA